MKRNRWYIGHRGGNGEPFQSRETPTFESHGHIYDSVIGPFMTKRGVMWAWRNPYYMLVSEAERRAKEASK